MAQARLAKGSTMAFVVSLVGPVFPALLSIVEIAFLCLQLHVFRFPDQKLVVDQGKSRR